MPTSKYRHIPTSVEAMQWTGENLDEINSWLPRNVFTVFSTPEGRSFHVKDSRGEWQEVGRGDWIVSVADGAAIERYASADFLVTFQPEPAAPVPAASIQEIVGGMRYGADHLRKWHARAKATNGGPSIEYVLGVFNEYANELTAAFKAAADVSANGDIREMSTNDDIEPQELTAVMWHDRHSDPTVSLFSDRDRAEAWARQQGHAFDRHGEYREATHPDDDELTIYYSCESDRLEVVTLTVDAELDSEGTAA